MHRLSAAPQVAVIGAGPAGLMAAEVLARGGAAVTVYDRMPSAGRKFLMAGRGGLNLTHGENFERFIARYGRATPQLRPAVEAFSPSALRAWCENLGEPTFLGSSGRIFPRSFKASPLLRAWLRRLEGLGVAFRSRHRWTGWDEEGRLLFATPAGGTVVAPAASILALGGATWPQLGSDGGWVEPLTGAGVAVAPLRPSNCGFVVPWSELFRSRFEGQPLKRVALSYGGRTIRGEAIVTRTGLEGGSIYALSAPLRDAIETRGEAMVHIRLRPDLGAADIEARIGARPKKQSLSTFLSKALKLSPVEIGLLHESTIGTFESLSGMSPSRLAERVHAVPLRLVGIAPIGRAISTAGGIVFDELDHGFMLRRRPGTFVAGEMLDWEAPTGGYLLQAVFATGAAAATGALDWLRLRMTGAEPQADQPSRDERAPPRTAAPG